MIPVAGVQMEQMSALRAESDRLVERVRASESTVGDLERELASAQEQVTSKKGEADRCCPSPVHVWKPCAEVSGPCERETVWVCACGPDAPSRLGARQLL